jgi:VPDSG-CTERM motif
MNMKFSFVHLSRSGFASIVLAGAVSLARANSIELVAGSAYAGYTGGSSTPYQNGQGGEFTALSINPANQANSWTPAGYDAKALYTFSSGTLSGLTGFETFCLEGGSNDVYFTPGTHYTYGESLNILGGPMGSLPLTVGTAWLYEQFATGQLSGYDYINPSARLADAGALQNTFWFLEGEIGSANNAYTTLVVNQFGGSLLNAQIAATASTNYGVEVLNLWSGDGRTAAQNQMIYTGRKVPDGGATLSLIGLGLIGLAAFRRRFTSAR